MKVMHNFIREVIVKMRCNPHDLRLMQVRLISQTHEHITADDDMPLSF